MTVEVRRSEFIEELAPLTWYPITGLDGHKSAILACPNGHVGSLSLHTIDIGGNVTPSVVCGWEGCGFHDYVRLLDWDDDGAAS